MSPALPFQFVDLYAAFKRPTGSIVSVIGTVTDWLPPRQSKGTDWTCTFSLADHTHGRLGLLGEEGLKVRFFAAPSDLPPIQGTGDVVVLRTVKITAWQGSIFAISTRASSWTVIHAPSIPEKAPASRAPQLPHRKDLRSPVLSVPEMLYAIELCNQHDRNLFTSTSATPSSPATLASCDVTSATQAPRDKFALVQDLEVATYRDLVGQVVKMYPHSDREEIYVTDYTFNNLLWNYNPEHEDLGREGDDYGYLPRRAENKKWPGPWGKQTLTVALWSPHAQWARSNVEVGDFVRLRNVHIKRSQDAKLEGVLHTDQRYPDRIEISLIKIHEEDDHVKDVLRRKRDYWKKYKQQHPDADEEVNGKKRKSREVETPVNKKQARKKRRKEREEARAKTAQPITKQGVNEYNSTKPSKSTASEPDLNPNIRCSYHTIRPRTLSAIKSLSKHANTTPNGNTYTLPFNNIKSRATVRIIDFFPPNLEDFAVNLSHKSSEYAILSDAETIASSSSSRSESNSPSPPPNHKSDDDDSLDGRSSLRRRRWEWRFGLTLEDASPLPLPPKHQPVPKRETLEILIGEQDAEYLLKLDASNLRKDASALAALREKLFLLWGDLEERKARQAANSPNGQVAEDGHADAVPLLKSEGGSSRPFQCCLKEYGVKVRKARLTTAIKASEGTQAEDRGEVDVDVTNAESEEEGDWRWQRRWRMWGCTII